MDIHTLPQPKGPGNAILREVFALARGQQPSTRPAPRGVNWLLHQGEGTVEFIPPAMFPQLVSNHLSPHSVKFQKQSFITPMLRLDPLPNTPHPRPVLESSPETCRRLQLSVSSKTTADLLFPRAPIKLRGHISPPPSLLPPSSPPSSGRGPFCSQSTLIGYLLLITGCEFWSQTLALCS